MTKVPHLRSIAILFLLAVVAFGIRRLLVAFAVTMALGITWELAEATVVGHYARLADLAPNLVSGILVLGFVAGLRWVLMRRRHTATFDPGGDRAEIVGVAVVDRPRDTTQRTL
ncbi:MAG TPA: hypothetical protein VN851_08900 [Thermoanaerobaculia bacterium]|nr:hypothetical protein [Thermoanaerobaculia bacterium]